MVRVGQSIQTVGRTAGLLLVLVVVFAVVQWGPEARERLEFASIYRQIQADVEAIEARRPEEIPARVWKHECWWAGIAIANVCFSLDHVPLRRMERFREDVSARLDGDQPLSLEFFDWLWDELANLSPTGADYVSRIGAIYRAESGPLRQTLMQDATETSPK